MASRKQVETKAAKLGGKLIVTRDNATLISPAGFHWDGYHSQVDYFDDGKQETWDYFWIAVNKQEPCDCESTTKNPKELKETWSAVSDAVKVDDASSIDQLIMELKTTRSQKAKAGA